MLHGQSSTCAKNFSPFPLLQAPPKSPQNLFLGYAVSSGIEGNEVWERVEWEIAQISTLPCKNGQHVLQLC